MSEKLRATRSLGGAEMIAMKEEYMLEVAREEGVIILHVEDDDGWVEILQSVVEEHIPSATYERFPGGVAAAVREILIRIDRKVILVADLRTEEGDPRSQFESLGVLLEKRSALLSRDVRFLVVSGYISDEAEYLFDKSDIKYFQKNNFSQTTFADYLVAAAKSFDRVPLDGKDQPAYEVEVSLHEPISWRECHELFNNQPYELRVTVSPCNELKQQSSLVGRGLVCHAHSEEFDIVPRTFVLELPPVGASSAALFGIVPMMGSVGGRRLTVFGRHKNHLAFFLEVPVKVV